jgi:SAM-dependent methyltransferase
MTACLVCGGSKWIALPDPGQRSMASDWRVVDERLARMLCAECGLVRRDPTASTGASFYASGYALYGHPPGDAREQARQDEYARWIAQGTGYRPRRVLDVGCGNGSLLRALRAYWPDAELLGCDPSRESIAEGFGNDLRLWTGTASNLPSDVSADLVIAVNVIEHTIDPIAFLTDLRAVLQPDGLLVIVCPDGGRPGLDLLFVDHVFSFSREHVGTLLSRAGLQRLGASQSPRSLGTFQMAIGRRRDATQKKAIPAPPRAEDVTTYLERWRQLDDRLHARVQGSIVCFGAGEAAGLLRAYAPRVWSSVRACTVDGVPAGWFAEGEPSASTVFVGSPGDPTLAKAEESLRRFGELPMIPLESVPPDETMLVGVRPADQPRVAERLAARFRHVVTWYDLVDGERV